ncbi:MAG TPA: sortase [Nocardioides sp.]|nr:sortase [Nocardioides sp.]
MTTPVSTVAPDDETTAPLPRRTPRGVLRLVGSRRPDPVPSTGTAVARRPFTVARALAIGVLLVTALMALFAGYLVIGAGLAADRAQNVMYGQLRQELAEATVPVSGAIAPGTPLGVVRIPSIGLDQVFVEGSSSEQTRSGPGLKSDSVLPGQTGVSVLVGHRSVSGAAFAHLDQVRPGDPIQVVTGQGQFTYVVDLVRTSDAPASRVRVAPARLSLVTSDPAYAPNRTLTVSAALEDKPMPASTGTTALPSEQPGHGSSSGLVGLLLWTQLLLLVTVLVTWAGLRARSRRGLWIGAVPVLLAILWQVFDHLAVLLPNTL